MDEQLDLILEQYDAMQSLYGDADRRQPRPQAYRLVHQGPAGSAEFRNRVNTQDDPKVVTPMLRDFYSPWLARSAA